MWADEEFVRILERVKAQRVLNGDPVKSIPELTKEIISSDTFKQVVKEIMEGKREIRFNMRMDKKRLW